jgi:uncharacterized protein YdaU (DUF1376 family)
MWNTKTVVISVTINRGNWNHLKITEEISEQHTWKALNQGTTENSHIGQRTHTAESTNVKVQNNQHEK